MGLIADEQPAMYQVLQTAGLTHGKGMQSYLCMMAVRLLEMRRVLKDTGSIYLHCDPTASHYLKLLMDSIYGKAELPQRGLFGNGPPPITIPDKAATAIDDVAFLHQKSDEWHINRLEWTMTLRRTVFPISNRKPTAGTVMSIT